MNKIIINKRDSYYYCLSLTTHSDALLDAEARGVFCRMLRRVAGFCGVKRRFKLVSFPIMLGMFFGLSLFAGVDQNVLSQNGQVDDEGFIHLFNGENLDGWHIVGRAEGFTVEDGLIRSEGRSGGNWMYWKEAQFDDFELVVEWRLSHRGNSGVFIRVPAEGRPWLTGYEVQINCESNKREAHHCTGSLYNYAAVNPRPDESPEVWRTFNIRAKGDHIRVQWDGETLVEYVQSTSDNTRDKPLSGFIGVQDSHAREGTWVEFRTIKVRPIATTQK